MASINPTLPLVNDVRNFVYRIRYATESVNYFNKAGNSKDRRNLGKIVETILNSQSETLHYQMNFLNRSVQQLSGAQENLRLIWNLFYQAITTSGDCAEIRKAYLRLDSYFPTHAGLETFSDTDMILYPDDFPDILPLNGIRRGEFENAKELYFRFASKLKFDKTQFPNLDLELFRTQVLRDVRILMSRPLGRRLIQQISSNGLLDEIRIKASRSAAYTSVDLFRSKHEIEYPVSSIMLYQDVPGIGIRSLASPSFISLAHELIHLNHHMAGVSLHLFDPRLPAYYTEPEEYRAIKGTCICHNADPINEDSLRAQFELFLRHTHLEAAGQNTHPDIKFAKGSRVGATEDMVEALPKVASPTVDESIRRLVRKNDFTSIGRLIETAVANPDSRKGSYLGAVRSPISSSSSRHLQQGQPPKLGPMSSSVSSSSSSRPFQQGQPPNLGPMSSSVSSSSSSSSRTAQSRPQIDDPRPNKRTKIPASPTFPFRHLPQHPPRSPNQSPGPVTRSHSLFSSHCVDMTDANRLE